MIGVDCAGGSRHLFFLGFPNRFPTTPASFSASAPSVFPSHFPPFFYTSSTRCLFFFSPAPMASLAPPLSAAKEQFFDYSILLSSFLAWNGRPPSVSLFAPAPFLDYPDPRVLFVLPGTSLFSFGAVSCCDAFCRTVLFLFIDLDIDFSLGTGRLAAIVFFPTPRFFRINGPGSVSAAPLPSSLGFFSLFFSYESAISRFAVPGLRNWSSLMEHFFFFFY